jgi:hypothetical protein
VPEVVAATGWQPHTVRGTIAGALKKELGLEIRSERVEGRGRVYRNSGLRAAPSLTSAQETVTGLLPAPALKLNASRQAD